MNNLTAQERIIVALDVDEIEEAAVIIEEIGDHVGMLKLGLQLGTAGGWGQVLQQLRDLAPERGVFADTKFKDIPQTMYGAARSIQRHQPAMFNIHADTNLLAMQQAVAGAQSIVDEDDAVAERAMILGVTVLTSISDEQSQEIYGAHVKQRVLENGARAAQAGLDGLVCSPQEAQALRSQAATQNMTLVTPGIRPQWAVANDQKRATTPKQALQMGADYLVFGRPINHPPNGMSRLDAVQKIIEELES